MKFNLILLNKVLNKAMKLNKLYKKLINYYLNKDRTKYY